MNHDEVQHYIPAIVACLQPLDPAQVILFGNGARTLPGEIGDWTCLWLQKLIISRVPVERKKKST